MVDRNSWVHSICRFLSYCRRTMAGGVVSSQHFGENLVHFQELPERAVGLIHGNREMPHNCRLFLGFVNILTVAVVVGLAMEGTSPDGPQMQQQQDDDDQADWSTVKEGNRDAQHDIPKLPVGDSQLPTIKEDVEKPQTGERQERPETSKVSEQYSSVCDYCTASAKKAIRLLTEFGYTEREEHTERSKNCRCFGGVQTSNETNHRDRIKLESVHTTVGGHLEGAAPGAAQAESVGLSRHARGDAQGEDQRHPLQSQVTLYWRNRVLDILAPSLEPLPDLFNDFGNMNEPGRDTGGEFVEGDQSQNECAGSEEEIAHESSRRFHSVGNNEAATAESHYDGGVLEEENAHERSCRFLCAENNEAATSQNHYECGASEDEGAQDRSCRLHHVENNESATDSVNNLETILETENNPRANQDAIQRERVEAPGTDQCYDESSAKQQNSRQIRVEIELPAPTVLSRPGDNNSEYPESGAVLPSRPDTLAADRHDSRSTSPMRPSRSLVVIYTPISAPTVSSAQPDFSNAEYYDAQPEFNNAPSPEYYDNNRDPNFIDAFSGGGNTRSGPPQYSSSDDDEIRSQPSSSPSSTSWSTPVPLGHPHLQTNSAGPRERLRPRGRALARRPRCGLRMMKALRDDPTCIPEEGKTTRQPGREDKFFKPRTGDVICRHTVVPGRGVVEIYLPGVEEHLQDGDSLVRLKMDNKSYPTMLILSAKAHLFSQGKWIYLGRHQHGVRKPKKARLPG